MKVVRLIGLGAIVSMYASLLQKNPRIKFTILADAKRKKRYLKEPLFLNNQPFDFNYETPEEVAEPADLILIATKFGQLTGQLVIIR